MSLNAAQFRHLIEDKGKVEAVKFCLGSGGVTEESADAYIRVQIQRALDAQRYDVAGMILWGPRKFDTRPRSVKLIMEGYFKSAKYLVQGAGSMGKSFTTVAILLMDWWRDPEWTSIKIISATATHAKTNAFATIKDLHESAIVPMPGRVKDGYIGLDDRNAITQVAIPAGDDGKGRLQGFHPVPRPSPHPVFGMSSRIRVMLDEGEEVPIGVWEGVDNLLVTLDGVENIKVIGCYNPKDESSKVAMISVPEDGASPENMESWKSANGWYVLRLDGALCENVVQKRVVYPGLMTYEGYTALMEKNGGNTPESYTFGRGLYPPQGVISSVITSGLWQGCVGHFVFVGKPVNCGGTDVAVDGRDKLIMTAGRYGLANAFVPRNGPTVNFPEPRRCLQIDAQFELKKGDTLRTSTSIREKSDELMIVPGFQSIDRTGNGASIHDYLRTTWGDDVQGVDFSKPATDVRILSEDRDTPKDSYSGIFTEVWFALARWMEFHYVAISPSLESGELRQDCLGRRYKLDAGRKLRVEKKDEYKSRLGRSPDAGDSLTIILHCVRMAGIDLGSMTGRAQRDEIERDRPPVQHDRRTNQSFVDITL